MNKKNIALATLMFCSVAAFAQVQDETVDVEKSYNPSVGEVEKLDENPDFDNEVEENKLPVNYTPINIPVQSDYKLSTINPIKLPAKDQSTNYNSFAKLGIGIPETFLGEAYVDYEYERNKHIGAFVHHFWNNADIKNVDLDTKQAQSSFQVFYKGNYDEMAAKLTAGYDVSTYNYYGLGDIESVLGTTAAQTVYNTINPTNHYHTAYVNAGLDSYENNIFDNADVLLRSFKGDFSAKETYGRISGDFSNGENEMSVMDYDLNLTGNVVLEYVHDDFQETNFGSALDYGYTKIDVTPMAKFSDENNNYLKVGFNVAYNTDLENSDSEAYFHPMAEVSIKPWDELGFFGGIRGNLKNNTYYDVVQNNPWIAPGVTILPTNTKYELYGGVKGVFNEVFQYKGEISYKEIENLLLMKNIPIQETSPIPTYRLENSFGLTYADANMTSIKGELNYVGIEKLSATASVGIFGYDMKGSEKAWNYPFFTTTLSGEYKLFDDALLVGADIYYVGERKDVTYDYASLVPTENGIIQVKDYIDLNLRATYNINERWGAFAKINNLLGDYDRYKNYSTQGAQFLVGATYKFNVAR